MRRKATRAEIEAATIERIRTRFLGQIEELATKAGDDPSTFPPPVLRPVRKRRLMS